MVVDMEIAEGVHQISLRADTSEGDAKRKLFPPSLFKFTGLTHVIAGQGKRAQPWPQTGQNLLKGLSPLGLPVKECPLLPNQVAHGSKH